MDQVISFTSVCAIEENINKTLQNMQLHNILMVVDIVSSLWNI